MEQKIEAIRAEKFILNYIKESNLEKKASDISNPIKMVIADILKELINQVHLEFQRHENEGNYELDGGQFVKITREVLTGFINYIDEENLLITLENELDEGYKADDSESNSNFRIS